MHTNFVSQDSKTIQTIIYFYQVFEVVLFFVAHRKSETIAERLDNRWL